LADAHVLALTEKVQSGIYNLGTSTGYTVHELIASFKQVTGKDIAIVNAARRQGDVPVMLADASSARKKLGWAPQHSLQEMVKSTAIVYGL
jgi:UDP-glucose 4-epimerase